MEQKVLNLFFFWQYSCLVLIIKDVSFVSHSCSSGMKQESNKKRPYEAHSGLINGRSDDGNTLRPFFDDWPRSSDSTSSPMSSSNCHLSISMPGNTSSDVSLKLSTGDEVEEANNNEREQQQNMNWWSSGGNHHNMGGPLAEALRSASSTSSVLHQMGISAQVFHWRKCYTTQIKSSSKLSFETATFCRCLSLCFSDVVSPSAEIYVTKFETCISNGTLFL